MKFVIFHESSRFLMAYVIMKYSRPDIASAVFGFPKIEVLLNLSIVGCLN